MLADYMKVLFDGVWGLFGIEYPGTGMTFGVIAIGALICCVSLKVLGYITGMHFNLSKGGSAQRGGNNQSIKVSDDRKGDTR